MNRIIILIVTLLLAGNSYAQKLSFDLGFSTFKYEDSEVIWELYYSFPDTMLTYNQTDDGYTGELYIDFIARRSGKEVVVDKFRVPAIFDEEPNSHNINIFGIRNYVLEPGEYNCYFRIQDLNSRDTADINFKVNINGFDDRNLTVSDLQLAKLIRLKDSSSFQWDKMFLKNNYYVIPNPSLIVDQEPYELKLYYEIYNAKKYAPDGVLINYTLYDGANREIFTIPTIRKSHSDVMIITLNQPLSMIPTGTYHIDVEISYPVDDPTVTINRKEKFFLINKYLAPELTTRFTESATFEKSEFSGMGSERIHMEYNQAKIIALPEETKAFEMLNSLRAKQRFMYRFWKNRDTDTNDFVNIARRDFMKAVDFANIHFKYGLNVDGWNTDRGRVLLKYGFPNQRDINVSDGDMNAYEEWFYNDVQGGATFIFVDKQGYNDFTLVHSTAFGEVKDYNWFDNHVLKYNMKNDPDSQNEFQEQRGGGY